MPFTIGKGNTPEVGAKDTVKLDEDQRCDFVSWHYYLRVKFLTLLRCQSVQSSTWSLHYLGRKGHQKSYRTSKCSLFPASPQNIHIMDLPVAKFSHRDDQPKIQWGADYMQML